VITGGPGSGKTTLLAELAARGYMTVEESARAIIAERLARGETPRPDPLSFAREILRRDIEKYRRHSHEPNWVFFDRGVIEAIAMVHEVEPLPPEELGAMISVYRFHPLVFILPPWEDIYKTDTERDQTFADAIDVHEKIVRWYRSCGYVLRDLPRLPVAQRADHVLHVLSDPRG
jgi:predicted ATPase